MFYVYCRYIILFNLMLFCFNASSNRFFEFSPNNPLYKIVHVAGETTKGAIHGAADMCFYGILIQLSIERFGFPINLIFSQCETPVNEVDDDNCSFNHYGICYGLIIGAIAGAEYGFYEGIKSIYNEPSMTNGVITDISNAVIPEGSQSKKDK